MVEIQKQSEAQVLNVEAQNKVDKSNLTPEQQEVQNKIDELRKKLDSIWATEKITKKAVEILYKWLTWDSSIKDDPEAKPTIELLERYKKAFEQAKKDRKITEVELISITETISKMWDKLEFSAWIDEKWVKLKYDTEKLKTISSKDFLSLIENERLQYVTKDNVDGNSLSSGSVKDIAFSFDQDWDGQLNKELYMLTTAGQVLPKEVREVTKDWEKYIRVWLKWEFFNWEKRLTIHDKTNITINKIWTPDELNNLEQENLKKYNEFVEKNSEFNDEKYKNAIVEALEKDIEPKTFLKVLSRRLEEFEKINTFEKIDLEMISTELAKISGSNKSDLESTSKVLRRLTPTTWQESLKDLWFKEEEVKQYVAKNPDNSKFSFWEIDSYTPAEYSFPAERSDSWTTLCSRTARKNLANLWVKWDINQWSSAKASFDIYGWDVLAFPPKWETDSKVADLYLDASPKNKDYGHRVAAFKEWNQWFVLDPYYKIWNWDTRLPIPAEQYVNTMQTQHWRKFWWAHYFA